MEKYIYNKEALPQPILEGREDLLELYDLAWKTAFDNVDYVDKAGWKTLLTCMPGVGRTWLWDSCFMTFITNYANGTFNGFNNLDNIYRLQREDGYISMAYDIATEQPSYGEFINPPLAAWIEWEQYRISGDPSRFALVLPVLEKHYDFIENNRKRPSCGLYYFETVNSSGMDNSPRSGDGAYGNMGSDVCYIDLACQQSLSAKCIAKMYEVLGNTEKAEFYKSENERINGLINHYHWSEKAGFYYDFFARRKPQEKVKLINTKTAASFWVLLCGAAVGERAARVAEHLMNPDEFYTHIPFASLSKDDLNYDPQGGYWLGSSWHPTTFAAIRGLYENGFKREAREATEKLLKAMSAVAKNPVYGGIWECYAPEADRPATNFIGTLCRPNFVGWGGLGPVPLLIEHTIGLHFEAGENTVTFEPEQKCGLKNMLFNGGKLDIEYTGESIVVSAEKPFTLILRPPFGTEQTLQVSAGAHTFSV